MILLNFSIFYWDFFAGSLTQPFGVLEPYFGLAMFYVYMISLFTSFISVYLVLKTEAFGIGLLLWVPYAVIGFFVEAYFELILNNSLINIWCVFGYSIFGILTGLSTDLSFRILDKKTNLRKSLVASLTGVFQSLVYFGLIIVALGFFYKNGWSAGSFTDPGTFLGNAYFGLPWMVIHALIGGFVAYSISHAHREN
ncbi:MAG: hypothetical protein GF317_16320 [Candidatus Lokiarchaeota archaeon]|nr:hypothetical protein [Candidatus Lokiarchaeota archaeon]MBD3201100.1 hypothetical protein [Candidatus Lokiarchaeota archaeon]